MKRIINYAIFAFIFALYFITFLMIYDNFRERKLNSQEKNALDILEEKIDVKEETPTPEASISYRGYTILGRIEIPSVNINTVILKEHTYAAMNIGAIKTYGVDLNEPGGFVISAHNFRGKSPFFYPIRLLKNGSKIYITDTKSRRIEYKVYQVSRYVAPNDTSYLTQMDGYHLTLVTCENGGKSRIVVKARAD